MPCLKIFTNLAKSKIPENFISKIIPVLSETVNKPVNKFVVMVSADCSVSFGAQATCKPGVVATLESIGNLGLEENKIITKKITEVIHKELGVSPDHFLMTFYDLQAQNVAKDGVTHIQKV